MANRNKEMDALMKALLLASMDKEDSHNIDVINAKITLSPIGMQGSIKGFKPIIQDIEGADEWFKETQEKLAPIMVEQATKLSKLMEKKFGLKAVDATKDVTDLMGILSRLFGGAKPNLKSKNAVSAIVHLW